MKIVLATRNRHKIREIKQILRSLPVKVFSMLDFSYAPSVKEDKPTFRGNAVKKAARFSKYFGMPALADDSGLEVKALKGAPGVRSARFAGPNPTVEKLCAKVLRLLKGTPASGRAARFVCCIALVDPSGRTRVFEGEVRGKIGLEMKGSNGFGYDPIFVPRGHRKTFAEMKSSAKNRLSHRAKALKKLKTRLKNLV